MNRRLAAIVASIGLVAVLGIAASATGLIFGGPSHAAWAAIVCTASEPDPLDDGTWQTSADRIAEAILPIEQSDLPDGVEEFHTTLLTTRREHLALLRTFARTDPSGGLDRMLDDLQRIVETRPRGTSTDEALGSFFATVAAGDARVRTASRSLPDRARAAIEDIDGCPDRLLPRNPEP